MRINLLLIALIFTSALVAEDFSEWPLEVTLQTQEEGDFSYWELSPLVYQYSREDLGDLRLVDATGKVIPWILAGFGDERKNQEIRVVPSVHTDSGRNPENPFPWSQYFQVNPGREIPGVNQLELVPLEVPYSLQVQVYGRGDQEDWQWITQDSLYQNEAGSKKRISFPSAQNYIHYRVDTPEQIDPVSWEFSFSQKVHSRGIFLRDAGLFFRQEEEEDFTRIILENPQRLPVIEIVLRAGGTFRRTLKWNGRSFPFYQYNPPEGTGEIFLTHREDRGKEIELLILNGDNDPVKIEGIQCFYNSKQIRFPRPENLPVTLYAGNRKAELPDYDLEFFRDSLIRETMSEAITLNQKIRDREPGEPQTADIHGKRILQFSLTGLGLLLVFLLLSMIRKGRES